MIATNDIATNDDSERHIEEVSSLTAIVDLLKDDEERLDALQSLFQEAMYRENFTLDQLLARLAQDFRVLGDIRETIDFLSEASEERVSEAGDESS
tara:strand:- start:115 stop:402 length:288 start_codon:yes stop_codon:yes gene_type:complete